MHRWLARLRWLAVLALWPAATALQAATLADQLATIAADFPSGTAALEAAVQRLPASADERTRLHAWRGLYVAGLWSDAGFANPLPSQAQAVRLLPDALALAQRLGDQASLSVLQVYQATLGHWAGTRVFTRQAALDEAVAQARASGDADALCLALVRKGETGWSNYVTPEWAPPLLEAADLASASAVCRAYATYSALALNAYLSGLSPIGAARGLADGQRAMDAIAGRGLTGLEDRLTLGRAYMAAMQRSTQLGVGFTTTDMPSVDAVLARARQRHDEVTTMAASVFRGMVFTVAGDRRSAMRAAHEAAAASLAPVGRISALGWAIRLAIQNQDLQAPGVQAWADELLAMDHQDMAARHRLMLHEPLRDYAAARGDFRQAFESSNLVTYLIAQVSLLEQGAELTKLQIAYDTRAKERDIAHLREREADLLLRRNLLVAGLAGSLLALGVVAWLLRNQWLQRRKIAALYGQLEQVNRNRSEQLVAACHDLRQPAFSLSLMSEAAARSPADAMRYIDDIRRNALLLSDMLSDLLDLHQLERADYPVTLADVSLGTLLDEVRLQFAGACRRKQLALAIQPCAVRVRSDAQLLRRILFNLVSNAVKYTDAGEVRVQVQLGPGGARLQVQDSGRGIPEDRIDDMFRAYARLDHADPVPGLGIGLAIVRHGVQRLGHALQFTSVPGQGTSVVVDLGAAWPEPDTPPPAPEPLPVAAGWVALVDDNDEVRQALAVLLEAWGFQVEQAASARQLEDLLDDRQAAAQDALPLALVTDQMLGADSGLALARRLRSRPGLSTLPVLLVTGDVAQEVEDAARSARITVLMKPARPAKLRDALRRTLQSATAGDDAFAAGTGTRLQAA